MAKIIQCLDGRITETWLPNGEPAVAELDSICQAAGTTFETAKRLSAVPDHIHHPAFGTIYYALYTDDLSAPVLSVACSDVLQYREGKITREMLAELADSLYEHLGDSVIWDFNQALKQTILEDDFLVSVLPLRDESDL